ncbi:hypothetical protein B8W69_28260 [Mycobacterium vulneris]|uniref:Uncharacterized protein n=1 Tax=Mycolicibacterium vulneris TaxID=547163 RepID=A0A1X2KIR0_9MYCO|nr:hypothetical protein [Mycolicibacterium vulneris]OSC21577.1 hypothetical protein B8W69_28260 [Mycolicibacterium vulneris]
MTHLRQHIEELDIDRWAAVTKQAATAAVDAAQRLGKPAPAQLAAVAAMSEGELIEHRNRSGPAPKRLSPAMQLVEADHLRAVAEHQARQAEQDKSDAHAAAQMARAEAEQSAQAAAQAREQARAAESAAARQAAEHAAELRSAQQAAEELRSELERVRANAAAEVAAAHEQTRAADERAEERAAERTEERATAQRALEELRSELERVRADASAEVAAAAEQARAADERAEARMTERAEERRTAQHDLEELRGELERVRALAAAEVAAARGQADGEVSTARAALARARAEADDAIASAREEIEQVRAECAAEVEAAREQTEQALASLYAAQTEAARARAQAAQAQVDSRAGGVLLSVPIPAAEIRGHTGYVEDVLATVRDLDLALETALSGDTRPVDAEAVGALVATVQHQAGDLSEHLRALSAQGTDAARTYVEAATRAYGGLLARIAAATEQLAREGRTDAGVIELVTAMLDAHPWRSR